MNTANLILMGIENSEALVDKEFDDYVAQLNILLQSNPDDYVNFLKKAILMYSPYHLDEQGAAIFEYLITTYPLYSDAYMWYGECLLGYTPFHEKAVEILRKGIIVDETNGGCHSLLALSLESTNGNLKEIEYHYKKAIYLEPFWPNPRFYLGRMLFKQGNFAAAKKVFAAAIPYIPKQDFEFTNDPIISHHEELISGIGWISVGKLIHDYLKKIDAIKSIK